jgi:glycosyltransferase involved in cell wall biosynthesis
LEDLDEEAIICPFEVYSPLSGITPFFSYVLTILRAPSTIIRAALRWRAEVIHVQDFPFSMAALVAARILRLPIVLEIREPYPAALRADLGPLLRGTMGGAILELIDKVFTFVEFVVCSSVRAVICISDEEKSKLVRLGIPEEKIVVVMTMPEMEEFSSHGDVGPLTSLHHTIVYAGLFLPWKGIDVLLEGFSYLLNEMPETRLVLLGDGPSRRSLEAQARRLSVFDKVRFLGNTSPAKAIEIVRAASVAVIPHQIDSMPTKLFFYLHCGKPVVASDFPSVRRILGEAKCGILFPSGDAKGLSDVLSRILRDRSKLRELSSNAQRAAMKRYNWENESRKLVGLYSSIA